MVYNTHLHSRSLWLVVCLVACGCGVTSCVLPWFRVSLEANARIFVSLFDVLVNGTHYIHITKYTNIICNEADFVQCKVLTMFTTTLKASFGMLIISVAMALSSASYLWTEPIPVVLSSTTVTISIIFGCLPTIIVPVSFNSIAFSSIECQLWAGFWLSLVYSGFLLCGGINIAVDMVLLSRRRIDI